MAPAIEALSRTRLPFRAVSEIGGVAERIAAVAERGHVDEIVIGTGRHPQWLRWLNPSIAQAVMERTDIPVTVLARGRAGALEPDLFARAEEEDNGMPQLCTIQRSQRQNQRRAAHAVIERAAGRAGPGEPHVLFRHRDRLADLHAE